MEMVNEGTRLLADALVVCLTSFWSKSSSYRSSGKKKKAHNKGMRRSSDRSSISFFGRDRVSLKFEFELLKFLSNSGKIDTENRRPPKGPNVAARRDRGACRMARFLQNGDTRNCHASKDWSIYVDMGRNDRE
jgi:hypothetical protein